VGKKINNMSIGYDTVKTTSPPAWMEIISRYSIPDAAVSWWQVANSVVPYIILWIAMYYSLSVSYLLTLFLSVFAAGFLVRIFIIFHDCGHGSFFKSGRLSRWVGIFLGILVFTPYHRWHHDHREHHMTVGNLDKRGVGDVKTLTAEEYRSLTKWQKAGYRLYRHPLFLLVFIPVILFVGLFRTTKSYMNSRQRMYVHLTTLAILLLNTSLIIAMGFRPWLMIQLPVIFLAAVAGVWLFYVQHQYSDVVWKRSKDWNYKEIALKGSSFYKLPRVLQWFSGNIGFHHIHHLGPRIPNYKLEKCHYENEDIWQVKPLTLRQSMRSLSLRLWDEENQRLIPFSELS
jgi:acyl-lipid omega-6 desaturase (Delta-12 desaturase)